MVGARFGMSGNELESVLYSNFEMLRWIESMQIEDFLFLWKWMFLANKMLSHGMGSSVISADMLPVSQLKWGELQFTANPKEGEEIVVRSVRIPFVLFLVMKLWTPMTLASMFL